MIKYDILDKNGKNEIPHMNSLNIKTIILWCLTILWMIFIFCLSAQPATQSDELSKTVTKVIIETVDKVVDIKTDDRPIIDLVKQFNHIVRKYAHGGVYFVLGLLLVGALRQNNIKGFRLFASSLLLCVIYAISDEVHQLFVPGRGAQVMDVLIDSMGAITGVSLYGWLLKAPIKIDWRQ